MTVDFISLLVIAFVAAACPLIAQSIPKKPIPETVLLLFAGAVLGPHALGIIQVDEAISLLSDLGLGFLFLLAGYEIDPKILGSSQGKRGLATWVITFVIAYVLALLAPGTEFGDLTTAALAIAMSTTALGALIPILKERGVFDTPIGHSTLAYGTWGELMPILAIAILLSTRKTWQTALILLLFGAVCIFLALRGARARRGGGKVYRILAEKADSTSQTFVRVVVLLLIALVAFSAIFDLDIVLGSFAAGFVLRYIVPEGNEELESKLDGIGYGFLIPIFFVVSGSNIDMSAVGSHLGMLVFFIVCLLLVRALPIYVALSTSKETSTMSSQGRAATAFYCATALPLIVAVTTIALNVGALSADVASIMVAAGAMSMLLMPLLAQLSSNLSDAQAGMAAQEIIHNPRDFSDIVREHYDIQRMMKEGVSAEKIVDHLEKNAGRYADQIRAHRRQLIERIEVERARREKERQRIQEWVQTYNREGRGNPHNPDER